MVVPKRLLLPRLRAGALRILGPLDIGAIRRSIEAVAERHETLRTEIIDIDGSPQQHVRATVDLPRIVAVDDGSAADTEQNAARLANEFFGQKIDIMTHPLFAAMVLKLSDEHHMLLLSIEHIVGDGVSCGILSRDVWSAYQQISSGAIISFPEMPIQFGDFAVWQRRTSFARRRKHEGYWMERMRGAPRVEIPTKANSGGSSHPTQKTINLPFGKVLSDELRRLARQEMTFLPIVVLAIYAIVMASLCDRVDFSMRFLSHRRHKRTELQHMIGNLAAGLFFRIEISPQESLLDVLRRAKQEFVAATDHQDFLPPPTQESVPEVGFNWGGLVTYSARWSMYQQRNSVEALRLQPVNIRDEPGQKFKANFSDTPSGIVLTVSYRDDLLDSGRMEKIGRNLRVVGEQLVNHHSQRISTLRLLWK
ncbi:condensation domain-containing protein [Steroidobacter agaridevorans]|uniref:condensation domain-containing protein n=1 Tax=Steroidobacter agaridevorans TaxID=2695856 RepID=UPI001FCAD154|nr:condensation domain-containing protein [Steroidobacter agaridevorans]